MTHSLAPDLLVLAGRCYRDFCGSRPVQGVAISAGRILFAGSLRQLRSAASRRTEVLDLGGATLTPGLTDAHTHFFYWALNRALTIDVSSATTLAATLHALRKGAAARTVGGWVLARGYDANRWPDLPPGQSLPTADLLDREFPDRPAVVRSRDGHSAWLNSAGLRAAGIGHSTPDPPGGRILRDVRGRPAGIVQESAIDALPDPLRDFAAQTDRAALRRADSALSAAEKIAWSLGLVGVHCMDDDAALAHFQRRRRAGRLGIRITHSIPLANLDSACAAGLSSGLGDDWLRIGAVKIFADGALGSQTAHMFDEYPGRPGYHGVPVIAVDALRQAVCRASARGWACWIHAIGDRAVHDAVVAIRAARRSESQPLPHRIEHAQCVRPADIRRMAKAGIFASMQPCHLPGDIANADRHWPRARRHAYPFRSLLDAGVTIAAGSDVPIEPIDPRRSVFAAVARMTEQHAPLSGWFPQEAITTAEILHAFTRAPAASLHQPLPSGTLHPGARADITVWDADPLAAAPAGLPHLPIRGVLIDGVARLR